MTRLVITFLICLFSCKQISQEQLDHTGMHLIVLGVAQDAGFPQAGCDKDCCVDAWNTPGVSRMVSSLGVVDMESQTHWIFDATPDFPKQMKLLQDQFQTNLGGIWLTHAHIGHYTGLMHLGHEVIGAQSIPVYAMPLMSGYLQRNGPWSQLVTMNNIKLQPLIKDQVVEVNRRLKVTPLQVPHRDEYSETVGYRIAGPSRKALFIPDIDKWHLWDKDLKTEIAEADWVFIDGSFYDHGELPNRDMSKIPHPMVTETIELLQGLPTSEKGKVHFIHLNHTNPLLSPSSAAHKAVLDAGFKVAQQEQIFSL